MPRFCGAVAVVAVAGACGARTAGPPATDGGGASDEDAGTTACALEPVRDDCAMPVTGAPLDRERGCIGSSKALFCHPGAASTAFDCIVHEPSGCIYQTAHTYSITGRRDWRPCSEEEWDLYRDASPCDAR